MTAETDLAALWRSLTPAQRAMVSDCKTNIAPYGGSQRKCVYNLMDRKVMEDVTFGRGIAYGLTDLGRALAAWAAEHGEAGS